MTEMVKKPGKKDKLGSKEYNKALADIYIDKGDDFQAKHTLRSVVENYGPENDGVKERASQKLAEIEAKEALMEQQARDSSFQIELNDNN